MTPETNLHARWAARLIGALVEGGVAHVVVSPGSRSTPLVLALADEARLTAHVVLDERSAAFVALGVARASGRAAAVIATSGTAPAHWYPAVIEASESGVPLVLLSADRPWEAQHAASPQTIDQAHLFGRHVRRYVDLGAPEASADAQRALGRVVAEALARALGPEPGPVHLNARFRKPLEPRALAHDPWTDAAEAQFAAPSPRVIAAAARLDEVDARAVAALWATSSRGLIAVGPMPLDGARAADALGELAARTGFPVYAEATSQLRRALRDAVTVPHLDLLLRAEAVPDELLPEVIIEVGAPPVASSWSALLERARATRIVVAARGVPDPRGDARVIVQGDVASSLSRLGAATAAARPSTGYSEAWRALSVRAARAVAGACPTGEARAAQLAASAAAEHALFLVGNSSPVRDVDAWAPFPTPGAGVLHQRGASGIDGLVAQAIGATIGGGRAVVALLGELTFLHDASSLASLGLARAPLTFVVVDNGGGRIFDELPIANAGRPRELERFFTTKQRVDASALAAAYGASFVRVTDDDVARELTREVGAAPRVVWIDAAPGSARAARDRAIRALSSEARA